MSAERITSPGEQYGVQIIAFIMEHQGQRWTPEELRRFVGLTPTQFEEGIRWMVKQEYMPRPPEPVKTTFH